MNVNKFLCFQGVKLIQVYKIQKCLRKCILLIPKEIVEIQKRIYKGCVAALNVHPTTLFVVKNSPVVTVRHSMQLSIWSSAHDHN